jgi:hypothetical protein
MSIKRIGLAFVGMAAAALAMIAAPSSALAFSVIVSPDVIVSQSLASHTVAHVVAPEAPATVQRVDLRMQPSPSARTLPGEAARFGFIAYRGPDTMKRPADDIKECTRQ